MHNLKDPLFPLYAFAVDHAGVGIHAVDMDGKTVIYNKKMKEIEGLELNEVADRSILELFNFDQKESTLLHVLQSGIEQLNVKQTYWNRKGMEITTVNDTYPVYGKEGLAGAVEIARDVTAIEKFVLHPLRKDESPVTFSRIIAKSDEMKSVISAARKAASAKLPVLLIGETGTGKDLIAESIHHESSGQAQFFTLFCRSAGDDLIRRLEADLQAADIFTLFCERIDLLSVPLQQKLLSVLQSADAQQNQLIASIGGDPVDLIASGMLLKDLYYFFASFTVRVPPLRKRKEDIIPFADSYLQTRAERFGMPVQQLSPGVKKLFLSYDWPGNIRELEILLDEITSLSATETEITYDMLPLHFRMKADEMDKFQMSAADFIVQPQKELLPLDQYLREAESYYLQKAMNLHGNNITKTAQALGMSRQNLQYRLRKIRSD